MPLQRGSTVRRAPLDALGLVALMALLSGGGCDSVDTGDRSPAGGHLVLLQFDDEAGEVLRAAPTGSVPPDSLQPPRLTLAAWSEQRAGLEEMVVALHAPDGRVLQRHAYPLRSVGFHDRPVLRPGRGWSLVGGPVRSRRRQVRLLVPSRPDAAIVTFTHVGIHSADVGSRIARPPDRSDRSSTLPELRDSQRVAGTVLKYRARMLAGLRLIDGGEPVPVSLPAILGMAVAAGDPERIPVAFRPIGGLTWPAGTSTSHEVLLESDRVLGGINVVILGDGFREAELDELYRPAALGAAEALVLHEPFRTFEEWMTIYRIDTPSVDSHVDYCPGRCDHGCPDPEPDPKETAFDVEGFAQNRGSCTNFRTDSPETIYDVTSTVIDPAAVDLWIVLVNCEQYGARAHDDEPIVFMADIDQATVAPSETTYDELLTHEVAHVLGYLGEEYVGGALPCPDPLPFNNVATLAEVESETVRWEALSGLTGEEFYRQLHRCDDTSSGIGLFRGATYIDDEDCRHCEDYWCEGYDSRYDCLEMLTEEDCDRRGDDYFRPSASCRMKALESGFCAVCLDALTTGLRAANRPTLHPAPFSLWAAGPE